MADSVTDVIHRQATPKPRPLICLTGIDGCGKSTQVARLATRLEAEGWPVSTVWCGGRPYLSQPAVWLAKRMLHAPRRGPDGRFYSREPARQAVANEFSTFVENSSRLFEKHPFLRRSWIDVSLFEHALEANVKIRPKLVGRRMVVSDRYLYRSVVNIVALLGLPLSSLPALLSHPAFRLAPTPLVYLLFDLPAEVAFGRKHDLPSIEYLNQRVPVYRALAELTDMVVIDATQDPDTVEDCVWSVVRERLEQTLTFAQLSPDANSLAQE